MTGNNNSRWSTKDKVLLSAGLALIGFEAGASILTPGAFRFELVLAGLALCGVSIAQWGDKRGG